MSAQTQDHSILLLFVRDFTSLASPSYLQLRVSLAR